MLLLIQSIENLNLSIIGTLGPVSNIILNGKEVTRSLSCAAELVLNHTMSKWELRLKPVGDILVDIQASNIL